MHSDGLLTSTSAVEEQVYFTTRVHTEGVTKVLFQLTASFVNFNPCIAGTRKMLENFVIYSTSFISGRVDMRYPTQFITNCIL